MAGIASLGRPRHSFARQAKAGIASLGRPRQSSSSCLLCYARSMAGRKEPPLLIKKI